MKKIILLNSTILLSLVLQGQSEIYSVAKAPFSKDVFDEFSPVYYNNSIVFCTNENKGLANYSSSSHELFFNIYYADTTGKKWKPKLFSKNLNTKLNDGPATFNSTRDTIYFSRNMIVEGKSTDLSSTRNKLGIFYAVLKDGEWTKIREFRHNNEWYNVTTPFLSSDGQRLYFSSDKPNGYGGSDLYYCQWKDSSYWDNPINLGSAINTSGNEAYPFTNQVGELFFSSDGHAGLGGKDIYFSKFDDTIWLDPIRLDPPINSEFDDFGILTDPIMDEGYFSSNRGKSIDIFHFSTNYQKVFYSSIQRENKYCFSFSDKRSIDVDTDYLIYKWDFGDGNSAEEAVLNHCYQKTGNYKVRLDLLDKRTGQLFFTKLSYNVEIQNYKQAYINSPPFALIGEEVEFDGTKSNLPGYSILQYSWDFGNGKRLIGDSVKNSFDKEGEYIVHLVLSLREDSTSKMQKVGVSKTITVYNNSIEKEYVLASNPYINKELLDIMDCDNAVISFSYSAEDNFKKDGVFVIELISSKEKINFKSSAFRKLPNKYILKERFNPEENNFSYTVEQQMTLMALYPAYRELQNLGFENALIKYITLKDPAERELFRLLKSYDTSADAYYDSYGRLTTNGFIMLDQIVKFLNKYTEIRLEVRFHTDNIGYESKNLSLSQRRASLMKEYLINRGIERNRVTSRGYGESMPIASNINEKNRKLNRRVEFIILN